MVAGFIGCLAVGFSTYHHTAWMWHGQQLENKERIERKAAVSEMRDLSLDLKNRYRIALFPATLILIGGILNGVSQKRTQNQSAQVNPCNPPENPRTP